MPTYQYVCRACEHTLEEFQSMTEPPLVRCPNCGTDNLARVIGAGAGLIFKGSGFYLTDYKNAGRKPTGETKEEKKKEKKENPPSNSPPPSDAPKKG